MNLTNLFNLADQQENGSYQGTCQALKKGSLLLFLTKSHKMFDLRKFFYSAKNYFSEVASPYPDITYTIYKI